MKAIINTQFERFGIPTNDQFSSGTLLLNKPVLVHIVEKLVELRVTEIVLVSNDASKELQDKFFTGEDYGVNISFLTIDQGAFMQTIQELNQNCDVLYVDSRFYPQINHTHIKSLKAYSKITKLQEHNNQISSWLFFPKLAIEDKTMPIGFEVSDLIDFIESYIQIESIFLVENHIDVFESSFKILKTKSLPILGKELNEGQVVGPLCIISDQSTLLNHLVIGESCKISSKSTINNCIIQDNVIISSGCNLENVIIDANTFIGPDISIQNAYISGDSIYYPLTKTFLQLSDETMLNRLNVTSNFKEMFFNFFSSLSA